MRLLPAVRRSIVFVAWLALVRCSPEPPPVNHTGRTEAPLWHRTGYAVDRTPIVGPDFVFAIAREGTSRTPRVYAFDRATGAVRWKSRFTAARMLGTSPQLVYVEEAASRRDHALDRATGEDRPFHIRRGLGDVVWRNGVLYGVVDSHELVAANALGATMWRTVVPVDVATAPIPAGTAIVVSGSRRIRDDGATLQAIDALEAASGRTRWTSESRTCDDAHACRTNLAYNLTGAIADDRTVYASYRVDTPTISNESVLVARDAATGVERWRRERSIQCADDPATVPPERVFTCENASSTGGLYAEIDGTTGAIRGRVHTRSLYRSDVVRDGSLFVSDQSTYENLDEGGVNRSSYRWLTRVDLRTGKELWRSMAQPKAEFTAPAAGDGLVVVGSVPFAGITSSSGTIDAGSTDVGGLWAWRYARAPAATKR